MKIVVIGASGMIGQRVTAEARGRGHEVTGVTRSGTNGTRIADASDAAAMAALSAGHDAVVLAVPPPRQDPQPARALLAAGRGVLGGLRKAGVRRLVVVGGAGSLEVAPGVRLIDTPHYPAAYRNVGLAQCALLDLLQAQARDLGWTYISPPVTIAPGERTGTYRLGGDQLLADRAGNSAISAEDYAVALVDELEQGQAIGRRITVASASSSPARP